MYDTQEKAKQMTDTHVLWGQSSVIEELIQAGKIDEEYIYPFNEGRGVGMVASREPSELFTRLLILNEILQIYSARQLKHQRNFAFFYLNLS